MEGIWLIVAVLIGLYIIALPVKMAAAAMGAKRTGVLWCLLALIGSSILHAIGLAIPCIGSIAAFLLSAVAFAAILGTGFLKGIGIEILVVVFSTILVLILTLVLGVSLAELLSILQETFGSVGF